MSSPTEGVPPVAIVAVVIGDDPATVSRTLTAVRRQVYEPSRVVIAGKGDGVLALADRLSTELGDAIEGVVETLGPDESHVWFVRAGTEPRPDALGALVGEAIRVDAAVAGSKLLRAQSPDHLLAVGVATDIFDEPYLGIDEDEIDHGQYDVVRDVAALSGASLLVRRDLARGLRGPDPEMAPGAAAIDLCQRARLRGGRVVVVPSSEALTPAEELDTETWREEAGRIRAMLKAYSWMTLAWALPARFLIGVVDAIAAPFVGRWSLFRFVAAWSWNLAKLPSTIRARRSSRAASSHDDAELFRFQLRGSAQMRRLGAELGGRVRNKLGSEDGVDLAAIGRDLTQPALITGAAVVALLVLSTRTIWRTGFPAARFSLPLPAEGWDAAGAYAGGWNPAGLGSIEPLPPFVGLAGVVDGVLPGGSEVASGFLLFGAFMLGVVGFVRLVRLWHIDVVPAVAGGVVLVAGPATRAIGDAGAIPTLVALGFLPWVLRLSIAPLPAGRRRIIGRAAGLVATTALLGLASPVLVFAAVAVVAVGIVARAVPTISLLFVALGALFSLAALQPWIARVDFGRYLGAGEAFWEPGGVLLVAAGVAASAALLVATDRLGTVAILGAVTAAAGGLAARTHALGAGREIEFAGLAVVALGVALVVAVVFETIRRVDEVQGLERVVAGIGALGAVALVVSAALVIVPGRGGLPSDELASALRFIAATSDDPDTARVLLAGPAPSLPGEWRDVRGAPYRVVNAPLPELTELWLPDPGPGDVLLEDVLASAIDGESFRIGSQLAAFGIRWVVFTGDSPLQPVLSSQLDLVPLEGLANPAFIIDDPQSAARARTSDGAIWRRSGDEYTGEPAPGQRLLLAESADSRWGPGPWAQVSWANELSADEGVARFGPIGPRRVQAQAVLGSLILLFVVAVWGRRDIKTAAT